MTDQDKLKIAAQALEQSIGGQAACLRAVELTIEALRGAVPAGWKLAPIEPTGEMLAAAEEGDREYRIRNWRYTTPVIQQGSYDHWCAMLAAAPQPAHKPLFAEMIAKHPGLREELLLQDALPAAQQEPAGEPVAARVVRRIIPAGHGTPEKSTYDVQWIDVDPYKFAGDLFTRPAVPLTDEREAFVLWLSTTYPRTFTVEDAEHKWKHEHVAALAWKKRATIAHKIGGAE